MSDGRANSSPSLLPPAQRHDLVMEGVAANVKLLVKLLDDYNHAPKGSDGRKPQRVAGMIGILDDIKSRIEKSQASAARRAVELRRCNTDLRRAPAPVPIPSSSTSSGSPKKPAELATTEDAEKLKKELAASHAARKSLERMFSSLGKEKEIMAAELARKAHELEEMEQLVSDLRVRNETLTGKVKLCASMHHGRVVDAATAGCEEEELKMRNEELGQKLVQSLDAYRALKRRFRDLLEDNVRMRKGALRIGERLRRLHGRLADRELVDLMEELGSLARMADRVQGEGSNN